VKQNLAAALALFGLVACQPDGVASGGAGQKPSAAVGPASLYRQPPTATAASLMAGAVVHLVGRAEPGAKVRLASPGGQAVLAQAGKDGVWNLDLPPAATPRLFGLAMIDGGHLIQSEGYVAVTPEGAAAQLRAGAGALVLGSRGDAPVILSVDFDAKGGAVVSGLASPHGAVEVWVDGQRKARGQAAADGVFSLAPNEPLTLAEHGFEVVDGSRRAAVRAALSPATPLSRGPYRSDRTPSGWRIDWMTPGGGLQTTLLLNHVGATA
jgi:hypothetical protein